MQVEFYGANYFPWVQTVLLALHEKDIKHTLRPLPPMCCLAVPPTPT
jgi:glutathione S-transferase